MTLHHPKPNGETFVFVYRNRADLLRAIVRLANQGRGFHWGDAADVARKSKERTVR